NSNSPRAAVKKNEEKRKNFKELLFINFNGATSWIQIRIASYCLIAPSKNAIPKICIQYQYTKKQNRKTSGILQDLLFRFSCIIGLGGD
ncbi:MAG: hypothetical protein AAB550_03645, partial [Patescibacteria group bacterium]